MLSSKPGSSSRSSATPDVASPPCSQSWPASTGRRFGGVVIDGTQVDGPGAERAIVFQSPCLLPWLTARQNVELGAAQGSVKKEPARDRRIGESTTWISWASRMRPTNCRRRSRSGTQQCVSLARALAVEPRFLLLDEPFSQLDSLTRFDLQDILLRVWERSGKTVVMVTHDVDEALYLADRLILMTDGPEASVGDVLTVPFSRPRSRAAVLGHPRYHECRRQVIDFLEHHAHQSRPSALDDVLQGVRSH